MAELDDLVVNGADLATDNVVRWRCVELVAVVKCRFSVEVHHSTIGQWLHQLRLTRLQPRPVPPKKDPAAEAAFKKRHRPGESGTPWNHGRDPDRDLLPGRGQSGANGNPCLHLVADRLSTPDGA
jgi:hypothetical protein